MHNVVNAEDARNSSDFLGRSRRMGMSCARHGSGRCPTMATRWTYARLLCICREESRKLENAHSYMAVSKGGASPSGQVSPSLRYGDDDEPTSVMSASRSGVELDTWTSFLSQGWLWTVSEASEESIGRHWGEDRRRRRG